MSIQMSANRISLERQLIEEALADPRWTYRTADGIAEQTHLNLSKVRELLEVPEVARRAVVATADGRDLYAAAGTRLTIREQIERVRWMLAR
jgi:hypothetical protein